MDGNGLDPALFDHINNALVGDMPSFGAAKESKFQQLMRSHSMTNNSRAGFNNQGQVQEAPAQDIRSYAGFDRPVEVDTGLCVEAKEFKPSAAPQPATQPTYASAVSTFESLSLSGQNGPMPGPMAALRPNPAAREFVPRNQSAPNLNMAQMPSPMAGSNSMVAPPIPGIREFIPNSRLAHVVNRPNGGTQPGPAYLSPQGHRFAPQNNARAMGDQDLTMTMGMSSQGMRKTNSPLMDMMSGGQVSSPIPNMDHMGNSVTSHLTSTSIFSPSQQPATFYAGGDSDSSLTASPHAGYVPPPSSPFGRLPMVSNGSGGGMNPMTGRPNSDGPDRSSPLQARRAATHLGHRSSPLEPLTTDIQPQVDQDIQRGIAQENFGGTTYFFTQNQKRHNMSVVVPPFHMFAGSPPSVEYMKQRVNAPSFFMSNELRQSILHKQTLTMLTVDTEQDSSVPAEVDNYHSLFPLEHITDSLLQKSSTFGFVTSCYKAIKYKDGLPYCLRRIHGFRQVNQKCMVLVEMWKKIQHANIVTLREVFTSKAFGEHSLIFSHDYHAGAETLMSRHFQNPNNNYASKAKWNANGGKQHTGLLPESLIWTYVVQLTSALRCIHAAGLACRVMDPTKIIIADKSRLRINGVGIFDVLGYDSSHSNPRAHMPQYQQDDLVALGKVVLALACNSVAAIQRDNFPQSLDLVVMNYSTDLKNFILYLLTPQQRPRSVNDIMPMIGARFYTQLDASIMRGDVIENELAQELENGRLFRLMAKICIVNERPGLGMDRDWSETGDRYLLKLFRDHVFHQVTETGAPWIDMAHIVQCLNKLDAGVPEKVCLMSRNEQNVLVVSYADLKRALQKCFSELTSGQG